MSISQLLLAMEENFRGHLAYVQERTPGMVVEHREDLLLVDSGLPSDTFNVVAMARFAEADADRRIAEAVQYFRTVGRPFAWWVGPGSRPVDLERRLQEYGLKAVESDLGMAMDLAELPSRVDVPVGLEVRHARVASELSDFAAVVADLWEPPDPAVRLFYESASPLLLEEDCPMRLFVGYLDGYPVAASELFVGGGAAGIYSVATRTPFRRRGIGTTLTWTALDEVRRLGIATAVLQASELGQSVYARLGFRACCHFVVYQ